MASSEFSPAVCKAVEESASQLWKLSKDIWSNPELAYTEVKAHDRMTRFLEERGFKVQRKYLVDTAFRAEGLAPGGAVFADANPGVALRTGASTDAGNVSHVLPTLHPIFDIGASVMPHTKAFGEAAVTEAAHRAVLRVAKALALTALDLMSDPALLAPLWSDFAGLEGHSRDSDKVK
ncbi:hypothetical protein HPB49_014894 [Dermacentor silvarum]|uniref:Uncharacterized protein n=1 Tax=Dermacentor silvarum TaxID=543639 RepID=A0ACB8CFN4_DERSI|nr:hypothetical protein HPB49_014894 [Dermacentor silvarum]